MPGASAGRQTGDGSPIVRGLPITHTPPLDPAEAIEIPAAVKPRLRLDRERSGDGERLLRAAAAGAVNHGQAPVCRHRDKPIA